MLETPWGYHDQTKRGATVLTDNGWNVTDTLASRADGTAGTSTFTYDWANRELTATSPIATGTTTTTYRLDGLIATRTAGNGETATLTYDPVKRPINVAFATGGSLWQSYDRTGNVATEGRTLTGISGNAGTGTQAFTYDALRRVTKATIPGTNTTCGLTGVACYGYDRDGNRTTKQVAATTTTYTYHPTDEIKDQTISGVTKTFLYNLFGSQTTAFDAANAVTTSAYDTAERLRTVTPPAGGAATYTYDALGRINTKTIGASVDTYSYLGSTKTAWQIANAGGSGFTTKSALDATGARTAVNGNALTGYLGFDLHGNTALAENASRVITDALRYDAWGELIASTISALPTPWRYQGRLDVGPDASNPLYDFGARAYRPVTGAFTSLDSYAGQAIDPLSMNRFLYAEGNPSSFVDPDGHAGCKSGPKCYTGGGGSIVVAGSGPTAKVVVASKPTAKSGGAAPPTSTIYRLPNELLVDSDGSLVDPTQFDALETLCGLSRPNGLFPGGPCQHWWITSDKITRGQATFLSPIPLALAAEFFKKYGEQSLANGTVALRISWIETSQNMFEGAAYEAGARYELSLSKTSLGNLSVVGARALLAVSVVVEFGGGFGEQLKNDSARQLGPSVRLARAALRGGTKVTGSLLGAAVGGYVGGLICEAASGGLGTLGCAALVAGMGAGGGMAGGGAADVVTNMAFQWLDGPR